MTRTKKHTWSNIEKGKNRIYTAVKNGENKFFRFVDFTDERIYGEWLTPYYAWRVMHNRNEFNTLCIQEIEF